MKRTPSLYELDIEQRLALSFGWSLLANVLLVLVAGAIVTLCMVA